MTNITSAQKLWTIKSDIDGYFYEIRCKGIVIDRVPLSIKAINYCMETGLIKKGYL